MLMTTSIASMLFPAILGARRLAAAVAVAGAVSISPVAVDGAPAAQAIRPAPAAAAEAVVTHHPKANKPKVCPIHWRRGPAYVEKLIRCAAIHWHVPGGPQEALFIAWRESHYQPWAYNPSGAEGIYQHMRQYWPSRAASYGFADWSAFNARANVIVTMRMVHALGNWAPWGE
jgi:Transglycosylase SLT domain